MDTHEIRFAYQLPQPIQVSGTVLSSPMACVLTETLTAAVEWPRLQWGRPDFFGWATPSLQPAEEFKDCTQESPGTVLQFDSIPGEVDCVEVRVLFVMLHDPHRPIPSNVVLERLLERWFSTFTRWLEVRTGQSTMAIDEQRKRSVAGERLHFSDSANQRREIEVNLWWQRPGLELVRPASQSEVSDACNQANSCSAVPLVHDLLAAARHWIWLAEYRRCVIDAYNAAELAVGEYVQQDPVDQRQKFKLERDIRKARERGFDLAIEPKPTLAALRHQAAHAGSVPTYDECLSAFKWTEQAVELTAPLPELSGRTSTP